MINRTKFPFFLILIMISQPVFSEKLFLDCVVDFDIHEIDIDLDKGTGKWLPYTSKTFTENENDPQYRLSINKNRVRFGKKPSDYIEIDLNALTATAVISISMDADDLSASGMDGEDLSASGMGGEDLSASGMGGEDLSASGMGGDELIAGFQDGFCEIISGRSNKS